MRPDMMEDGIYGSPMPPQLAGEAMKFEFGMVELHGELVHYNKATVKVETGAIEFVPALVECSDRNCQDVECWHYEPHHHNEDGRCCDEYCRGARCRPVRARVETPAVEPAPVVAMFICPGAADCRLRGKCYHRSRHLLKDKPGCYCGNPCSNVGPCVRVEPKKEGK
jgi:hypothetical protein